MAAPTRGNEETLIADATSLAATTETTFDWDLTGAWWGTVTIEVTFPSSGVGDVTVYACRTEVATPGSGDYPTRSPLTGRQIGVAPGTASSTVTLTCDAGQGLQRIRVYNAGSSGVTIAKCCGRKYA